MAVVSAIFLSFVVSSISRVKYWISIPSAVAFEPSSRNALESVPHFMMIAFFVLSLIDCPSFVLTASCVRSWPFSFRTPKAALRCATVFISCQRSMLAPVFNTTTEVIVSFFFPSSPPFGRMSGKSCVSRIGLSTIKAKSRSPNPKPHVGGMPCSSMSTNSHSGIIASSSPLSINFCCSSNRAR